MPEMCRRLLCSGLLFFVICTTAQAARPTREYPITVDSVRLSRTQLLHWQRILGGQRVNAVRFLVDYRWARGEAKRRGVRVTQAELRRAYRREVHSYSHRDFARLLRESHQTRADFRVRVYRFHYETRLREFAVQGIDPDQTALDEFVAEMTACWQPLTRCAAEFFVADSCAPGGH